MAIALIAGVAAMGSAAIAGIAWSWAAFALGAGLSMVSRALMPKPDLGTQMGGRSVMTREAASSRKIIYGRARVGGNVVYLESTGTDNKYLWLVTAIAGHEIDAYEQVWFNDKKIWDGGSYVGNWGSYVSISFKDGSQTTADSGLVAASTKWTSDHKLLDTAYMVVKLTYDQEQFAQGLPNISTVVRGKKVLHTAEISAGNFLLNKKYKITQVGTTNFVSLGAASNTVGVEFYATNVGSGTGKANRIEWSQNPALCLRDYLTDTKYGLGESASNIASINTAIGVCNETVALAAGGTQPRYTMDGVVDTADSIKANIENMTGAMIGRLIYSGGKFEIHAGEYVAPTVSIDESMMVGEISVQTKQSRRNAYNGVKGVFLSEEDNYILADYPAQISSTYATQDGDPVYLDMPLPYTVNNIRAQRIAKLALFRSRQQEAITIPCNLNAFKFKIGDNINVSNTRLGYSSKVFEVVGYSFGFSSDQMVVNVEAIETASSIWDWTTSDEEVFLGAGEVALYDGTTAAAPTNLTVTADSYLADDGTYSPYFNVTWDYSDDAFVDHYIVEWRTGSNDYYSQTTKTKPFEIRSLQQGASYDVRVKAVNEINVSSAYLTGSQTPATDTTAPDVPTSVSAVGEYRQITISWTNPTQKDLLGVEVFRSDTETGTYLYAGNGDSSFIDTDLETPKTYYYKVRSYDRSFNKSNYAAIVSATSRNVTITAPDNSDVVIYDGESGIPPSVTTAVATTSSDSNTFYLKQDYKEHLELHVSYPVGALTSGTVSGETNAINAVMSQFKFQIYYAPTSNPTSFTQFGSDLISQRKTTTGQLISNYFVKTTDLGSGNYKAELQTKTQVRTAYPTLSGYQLGVIDDDYNLTEITTVYDFPSGEYVFKVVVTVTDGSYSPYPATGSPSSTLARTVKAVGYQQVEKSGYSYAFEPYYQPTTIFRDRDSDEVVRLSDGDDTLEIAAINDQGKPRLLMIGPNTTNPSSGVSWGASINFVTSFDSYSNGGLGEYQIGIDKSGTGLYLGSGGYRPQDSGGSELKITNGRTDVFGDLYLNGVEVGTDSGSISGVTAGTNLNGGGTSGTVTLNLDSTITGDHTFEDNLVIEGNLTVQGTTTTVDTDDLNVKDKNITLNYSTGDSSANANGAGITIQDAVNSTTNATILWDSTNDKFDFSHNITAPNLSISNWNTAYTYSQVGHLPLSGGTLTGGLSGTTGSFSGALSVNGKATLNRANGSVGAPDTTNHDTGTRIELYNADATAWYAIGIESNTMWFNSDGNYKFYVDAVSKVDIDSSGVVNAVGGYKVDGTLKSGNWDTAYTYSQVGHLPLSGGTLTGTLSSNSNIETTLDMKARILYSSATNNTYLDLGSDSVSADLNASGAVNLAIGGATIFQARSTGVLINSGGLMMGGSLTEVIDSSRNLTNIGTISSGAITSTGSTSVASSSINIGFVAPNGEIKVKNTTGAPASNLDFYTTNSSGTTAMVMRLTHEKDVSISRNLTMNGTLDGVSTISANSYKVGSQEVITSGRALTNLSGITTTSGSITSYGSVKAGQGGVYTNSVERITNAGNLTNIGTISSGAITSTGLLKLETAGNVVDGTYYSTLTINNTGSSTYSGVRFDRSNVAKWRVGLMPDDKFQVARLFNGVSDDAFTINSSGTVNVGVGALQLGGTTVIDASRNLTNLGVINGANQTSVADRIGNIKIARIHYTSGTNPVTSIDNLETFILSKTDGGYGSGTKPSGADNSTGIISLQTHSGNYFTQLALSTQTNDLFIRSAHNATSYGSYQKFLKESTNITVGTISSGAITSTGDISANSGKVRMGNPTLLSGRSSIRIDSDGDSFADLVFGDNVTSTSWTNANWAISSRSSSESNSLKIYRGSGQPSPYNSEHVLMEFKQNNVVSVNSTLQINNTTVIDASRNLVNIVNASTSKLTLVASTASNIENYATGTGTPTTNWRIAGASSNLMTLSGSGNLTIAGSLTQNSDRRIKDNIAPITDALSKTCALQGSTYTRTDKGQDKDKVHAGLIAQDVEAVLPEAVGEIDGIKTIDYSSVIALLVESIKDLKSEVNDLKTQLSLREI